MVVSNVQLYEALKKDMSKENARLLVEAISPEQERLSRADLLAFETRLTQVMHDNAASLRGEMAALAGDLRGEMAALAGDLRGEMAALAGDLRGEMVGGQGRLGSEITELRADLGRMRVEFTRWILAFFVPLWITAAAAIVTNVLGS